MVLRGVSDGFRTFQENRPNRLSVGSSSIDDCRGIQAAVAPTNKERGRPNCRSSVHQIPSKEMDSVYSQYKELEVVIV